MSFEFDWQVDEEERDAAVGPREYVATPHKRRARHFSWRWLLLFLVGALLIGATAWIVVNRLNKQAEADLVKAITAYQKLEGQAARAGDGDLFRSVLAPDPALLSAQFLPRNSAFNQAESTVLSAKPTSNEVWTTVQWQDGDETLSRVLIYERDRGKLRRSRGTEHPWEQRYKVELPWGRIWLYEADLQWQHEIEAFVGALIEELCAQACLSERLPLDLVIQRNFSQIAVEGWIHIPSPHLTGITTEGVPADYFWQDLERRIVAQLTPVTIRFGVPVALEGRFQALADKFHAEQGAVTVSLVPFDQTFAEGEFASDDALLAAVDGAFMMPTVEQISSGKIVDLSDYAATDPTFEPDDFYQRVWAGSLWQGRLWALPQAGKVRLLFYPNRAAGSPEVTLADSAETTFWSAELQALLSSEENQQIQWDYIDAHNDLLLALLIGKRCADSQSRTSCRADIDKKTIVQVLTWYAEQVRKKATPDLVHLAPAERDTLRLSAQSVPPEVVFWVEEATQYENYRQLHDLRITPITDGLQDARTPMHVQGSIIRQGADAPRAVWRWINFLSRQRPVSPGRDLPARKSVKRQIRYFAQMPAELRAQMKVAIAGAWPVQIDERHLFSWKLLDAFLREEITADEAADRMVDQRWFTEDGLR